MIVVYCANKAIYHVLPTAINSLLKNNEENIEKIYLLIEDDSIDFIDHSLIKFININNYPFIFKKGINCTKLFPYMAMARCYLSKILSEDKVLYLDVDTIVDGDLTELWNYSLGSSFVGAREESSEYFNSGVLLMNLKLLRDTGYDDRCIKLLKNCRFQFPDQDAMNFIFKNRILYIPDKFNKLGRDYQAYEYGDIVVRHYAGITKPWKENASEKDIAFWKRYFVESITPPATS